MTLPDDASIWSLLSSLMFFLKALMPWARSPMMLEILPRPPNSTRTITSTISQCQMLLNPIGLLLLELRLRHPPLAADYGKKLPGPQRGVCPELTGYLGRP